MNIENLGAGLETAVAAVARREGGTGAPGFVESIEAATGRVVKRFRAAEPREIAKTIFPRAREAQVAWARKSIHARAALLMRLREVMYRRRDEIAQLVSVETGKPRAEAVLAEVMLALDSVEFFARRAPDWLRTERVAASQRGAEG